MTSYERIKLVMEQIRWDMKRGKIELLSIEDVMDAAERLLPWQELDKFIEGKEYIGIYQDA